MVDDAKSYKKASRDNKTLYNLPVHCLQQRDRDEEFRKGAYPYFHAPYNAHNRFMSSIVGGDKLFLREFERPATFTIKPVREGGLGTKPSVRVTQAPGSTRRQRAAVAAALSGAGASPAEPMAQSSLQTGAPVLLKSKLIRADMQTGKPAGARLAGRAASAAGGACVGGDAAEPAGGWKTTVVKAFSVKPHKHGHREGGARPFHQSYMHYKYHGFSGQGAKTSWGVPATKAWRVPGGEAAMTIHEQA